MYVLRDVTFAYPSREPILRDINLDLAPGEFVLLRGPSGGGKSTLLRLLNRLLVPQAGEIYFRGQPLGDYDLTKLRRKAIYLQQTPVMLSGTVRANLTFPFAFASAKGVLIPEDERLRDSLDPFGLADVSLEAEAANLSVGQKQRLALARALLLGPEVLLLDEPTASLDPESRHLVEKGLEDLNAAGKLTVIMVLHSDYQPQRVATRVFQLEAGAISRVSV